MKNNKDKEELLNDKNNQDTFVEKDGQDIKIENTEELLDSTNLLENDEKDIQTAKDTFIEENDKEVKVDNVEELLEETNLVEDDTFLEKGEEDKDEEEIEESIIEGSNDEEEIEESITEGSNDEEGSDFVNLRDKEESIKSRSKKKTALKIGSYILMFFGVCFIVLVSFFLYSNVQENKTIAKQTDLIINNLRVQKADKETNKEIGKGDAVVMDYAGSIDGKAFEGGTQKDARLEVGSGTFIDGFEDQLIGHKKGDKFDIKVTFPKDYQVAEYAGKEAKFAITVKHVYSLPELNDAFVKSLGIEGIETVDQLRDYTKNYYQQSVPQNY